MISKSISTKTYFKLLGDLRSIIAEGKQKAMEATNQILVETYWQVGKRLCEGDGILDEPKYQQEILADISDELSIDVSTLKRSIYFFQTYKSATSSTFLTWSHYKILLSIQSDEQRAWYENLAEEKSLTCWNLIQAVKNDSYTKTTKKAKRKTSDPGINRPTEPTYIYKGYVDKVIDGDTLVMKIDLGFQVLKEQRIRLAEIDCPSLDEPGGLEAQKYVSEQLLKIEFVMVKTNKIDIYGRYVGYIFYAPLENNKVKIFTRGRFLNQELVEKGFARLF